MSAIKEHYHKEIEKGLREMEDITVKGELLFKLDSKRQWIDRVPQILPDKIRAGETWLWVDKNGNIFETGADFSSAEKNMSYPCKVYRLQNVASANTNIQHSTNNNQ